MIFVFVEDGTVDVIEDIQEARRNYEGVDVESLVYQFFNDLGVSLRPVFVEPNKYGSILGIIKWCESGVFDLEPDPESEEDSIWTALYEAVAINPNPFFKTIEEIKVYLRSKDGAVEEPSTEA